MLILRFRKEEDGKHILKKVRKMKDEISDVEELLNDCMEEYDDYENYRDDYDDYDNYRRMRRSRMNRRSR